MRQIESDWKTGKDCMPEPKLGQGLEGDLGHSSTFQTPLVLAGSKTEPCLQLSSLAALESFRLPCVVLVHPQLISVLNSGGISTSSQRPSQTSMAAFCCNFVQHPTLNSKLWTYQVHNSDPTLRLNPEFPISMTLPYHISQTWIQSLPPLCSLFFISFTSITLTLLQLLFL